MATVQAQALKGIASLLGGRKVIGRSITRPGDMRDAVRAGLPYASMESLMKALKLSSRDLTSAMGVAPRTLARRKQGQWLSPAESDRLFRVAWITQLSASVLGSMEKAAEWLRRPNRSLGGRAPVALLDTEIGAREVEEVLNRINFGVYS
jgi:putative toxin-antitoxin system antitoxin component (TIGR02293 family)